MGFITNTATSQLGRPAHSPQLKGFGFVDLMLNGKKKKKIQSRICNIPTFDHIVWVSHFQWNCPSKTNYQIKCWRDFMFQQGCWHHYAQLRDNNFSHNETVSFECHIAEIVFKKKHTHIRQYLMFLTFPSHGTALFTFWQVLRCLTLKTIYVYLNISFRHPIIYIISLCCWTEELLKEAG